MQPFRTRSRLVVLGTAAAVGIGLFAGLGPTAGGASSHREAPLIAADPQADNTDLYAFVSPDKPDTVTHHRQLASRSRTRRRAELLRVRPPTSATTSRSTTTATPSRTSIYRWTFTNHYRNRNTFLYNTGPVTSLDDADLNFYQTYTLERARRRRAARHAARSRTTCRSRRPTSARRRCPTTRRCATRGASQALGERRPGLRRPGRRPVLPRPARLRPAVRRRPVRGRQRHAARLQRQHDRAAGAERQAAQGRRRSGQPDRRHLVTTTARGRAPSGVYAQVSRLGMPLVNEVVIPLKDKDTFNASKPADDGAVPAVRDRPRGAAS